jgi:hypothetical protein
VVEHGRHPKSIVGSFGNSCPDLDRRLHLHPSPGETDTNSIRHPCLLCRREGYRTHLWRCAAALTDRIGRRASRSRASVEEPDGEARGQAVRQRLLALRGSDERQPVSDKHSSQRRWHQHHMIAQENSGTRAALVLLTAMQVPHLPPVDRPMPVWANRLKKDRPQLRKVLFPVE